MILKKIQNQLEALYRFELEHNVEDFIVTDPASHTTQKKIGNRLGQETLLVKQTPEAIEIGLYVDEKILSHLHQDNPYQNLGPHNLNAFCVAAEGVSHFLYLLNKAKGEEPVTQLELELQAEVDKYLLATLLFYTQTGSVPDFLFSALFENFNWETNLTADETLRYKEANWFATKFCAYLNKNFIRYARWQPLLDTARHFYRLNHWSKIRKLTP